MYVTYFSSHPRSYSLNHFALSAVTMVNKSSLLQYHILEEMLIMREENLRTLARGIHYHGLASLVQANLHLIKPMFVAQLDTPILTPVRFWSLVELLRPHEVSKH